jgi:hypothetical protein
MEIEQAVQTPAAKDSPPATTKPKSIGGGMVLFCIGTILLTPMMLLSEVRESKLLWVQVADSVLICASLAAGFAVVSASSRAKLFVRIYFLSLLILAARYFLAVLGMGELDGRRIAPAVRITLYVFVWALYFRSSKRVKETFGENW